MGIKEKIIEFIANRKSFQKFRDTHPCYQVGDVQCPNFEICESYIITNGHGGVCFLCDVEYGKWQGGNGVLQFKDNEFCCICLDTTRCVKNKCNHYICINDFKRCFYGEPRVGEPLFPYPELEDDYYRKNQHHPSYENDPVIIKYHQDRRKWDDYYDIKYQSEGNLRKCPICRI
jgi:hypothetical protein